MGTPGAVPPATPAPPAQVGGAAAQDGQSMAEQLQRLGELKADGILTDEEFATAKRRLIDGTW